MDDGKLVEEGTPEAIFEHPKSDRLQNFLGEGAVKSHRKKEPCFGSFLIEEKRGVPFAAFPFAS